MKKWNLILIAALSVMINACKKTDTVSNNYYPAQASYTVRMTDDPGPYQEVNIDLRGVEITGSAGKTILLNVNSGIYNLLEFSNGLDTIIATGMVDAGHVEQIRLILGPNNTVVVDGDAHLLEVPSAEQSGLKLQVHQKVDGGASYAILLDFDANQSIIKTGNGKYKLKPVIRTVNHAIAGSIKGAITPGGILASVTATNGTGSYSSMASVGGVFMIMGLPPGDYDVTILPSLPYKTVVKTNIRVEAGESTDIGAIDIN
jgi:outer membrane lipoprotein SlyB